MEDFNFIKEFISNVGFPIGVTVWLLVKGTAILNQNTQAFNKLADVLASKPCVGQQEIERVRNENGN